MKKKVFITILFAVLLICITPITIANAQSVAKNEFANMTLPEDVATFGGEVLPCLNSDSCDHDIVIDWGMEPTCLNNGLTEGAHCSICGEVLVEQEVIFAIGHSFADATCTEPATCMRCGLIEGEPLGHAMVGATCTEPISCLNCDYTAGEALGHDVVIDEAVAPTCAVSGLTEGAHCDRCGEILVEQEEVFWCLPHNMAEATCTEPSYCIDCGLTGGEALGHDMAEATCTEPATCLRCDYTEGEALGHDVVIDYRVEPTCISNGMTDGAHCDRCGEILVAQELILALGHDMQDATCELPKTCSVCGYTEGSALGHNVVIDMGVSATCTETGLTDGAHCDRCGEILVAKEVILALGHDMQEATCTKPSTCARTGCGHEEGNAFGHDIVIDEATDATCLEGALTIGAHCGICGDVLIQQEEIAPALGHSVVVDEFVASTCTETGLTEGSHCDRCGEVLVVQEVILALGHEVIVDEEVAPTCLESGLTGGAHCDRCGETLIYQEEVSALGHNLVIDAAVAPTCTETGLTEGAHCDRCDYVEVEQEALEALGHTAVVDSKVDATCTEDGLTEGSHCDVCGEVFVAQEVISASGHNFGEWEETIAPTETEDGEKQRACDCGEVEIEVIPALNAGSGDESDLSSESTDESEIEDVVVGCLGSISPSGVVGFALLSAFAIIVKKRRNLAE